ncbi:MAG: hypothetical protein JW918_13795 [Anaerolineae bacterium]|nr:hypothetical protein [Anaerolineae bacterium]
MHLFLFDVDSVLVEANGYLKALQDTVAHFSRQMGVGAHPPTEAEVRALEAHGLTSEWDSAPTCIAALLAERLRREPTVTLPNDWTEALATLAAHPFPLPHPDYTDLAQRVGESLANQPGAAHAARAVLWEDVLAAPSLEPHRPALDALFDVLLGRTHDFYRAPVTRHFQHLVIGSQGVRRTYGITPDFESAAYLQAHDRPLLAADVRARLQGSIADGGVRVALYTARPSLTPVDADVATDGYSPEAEMARSLVKLDDYPLIGLGRVRWLAERAGERVEHLVKPSPVQALAAIGAAQSGQETGALEAALALHQDSELGPPLANLDAVTVHVFEDSPGGIDAVKHAIELLRAAGLDIAWQPHGITPADGPKAEAMAARDVPIYPSINQAILDALETI